jgi:hypothetical protein
MSYASSFGELVGHVLAGQLVRPGHLDSRLVDWSDSMVKACVLHDASIATRAGWSAPIVDASMIYETYLRRTEIRLYEDHEYIKPPWDNAWVCYRNEHGNLACTLVAAVEGAPNWESEENDLSEATHIMMLLTYCGGTTGDGLAIPTFGPYKMYRLATDADGRLIDIQWTALDGKEHDPAAPEWPLLCVLGAYTLLNCRNIELVPKTLDRAERRRRERAGVGGLIESTINIRAVGRRYASSSAAADDAPSRRLHSVRGAVHHYGDCCPGAHEPRGLLFGRITGRVWVPQHARGLGELGETRQTYRIQTETGAT